MIIIKWRHLVGTGAHSHLIVPCNNKRDTKQVHFVNTSAKRSIADTLPTATSSSRLSIRSSVPGKVTFRLNFSRIIKQMQNGGWKGDSVLALNEPLCTQWRPSQIWAHTPDRTGAYQWQSICRESSRSRQQISTHTH